MPTLIFIGHDGTEYRVDALAGQSVMQAAVNASVPSILADCGGNASCGTCHGYVDTAWLKPLPEALPDERAMLECVLDPKDNSRLTCQITVTESLDQMVIRLPEHQS